MKGYSKHSIPPTDFGHSYDYNQGGALEWIQRDVTEVCEPILYVGCNTHP